MTVDRISGVTEAGGRSGEILMDGLFTGMLGALVVALWFLCIDLIHGRPFYTPALLGTMLMHGGTAAAGSITIAPLEIAAYTAFHFVAFIAVGVFFSWMMSLFDRFPIMFFVILVLAVCLQIGFVAFTLALHFEANQLGLWSVVVANLLAAVAMGIYLARRHPGALKGVDRLWEHTD
jgi:hypothetical protein